MGMKGFIAGSLVTLGVVGLVAALKDMDFDCFGSSGNDYDSGPDSSVLDFGSFADDGEGNAEETHGSTATAAAAGSDRENAGAT